MIQAEEETCQKDFLEKLISGKLMKANCTKPSYTLNQAA